MVARAGIEPATFRFSGGRSYQLSYLAGRHPNRMPIANSATLTGLEPATSAVTGRRANQLRYGANFLTCWLSQPGNYSVTLVSLSHRAKALVATGLGHLPGEVSPSHPQRDSNPCCRRERAES